MVVGTSVALRNSLVAIPTTRTRILRMTRKRPDRTARDV